jgi:methionine synthase I (cobalamin-dependent)
MPSRLEALVGSRPILTDGAWGTELQQRGLAFGECPDAWNLSRPEAVEEVARAYVDAGSRIILTNTFRANRIALDSAGLGSALADINRAGVAISKKAAGGRARVFASIGPTGKTMLTGEVNSDQVRTAFAEQARALAEAGADALLIETMSDLEEARLALAAALDTGLPAIVSFTFDSGRNKDRTMMGITPEEAAQVMQQEGAGAIGANCGRGIEDFLPVCRRLRNPRDLPIWIKPNAGLPQLSDGRTTYATTPEEFAAFVPALIEAGATFVGGCCGTSPAFIRSVAGVLAQCV